MVAVSKILVFNVPAHGHVNPTLPVVRELVSRGEQVVYYLTDEFEPQIRQTGAEFRRIKDIQQRGAGPPPGVTAMGRTDPAKVRQMMAAFFPRMMAGGLRLVPGLVDQVRAEDADCVIYDPFCPWGRVLAAILGLPAEALNIVTLPRAFQPDADALDERYVFVGPSISPRGDASGFPLDQLAGNPTLYVSLGTVFNANPEFFDSCFDAFAGSAWQVVLSVGARAEPSSLDRIPDNFLVRPHVPQLEVLEHTDVFVTHGGMNSVMEAVYYGVPMVVVPQQPEQAMTAAH